MFVQIGLKGLLVCIALQLDPSSLRDPWIITKSTVILSDKTLVKLLPIREVVARRLPGPSDCDSTPHTRLSSMTEAKVRCRPMRIGEKGKV